MADFARTTPHSVVYIIRFRHCVSPFLFIFMVADDPECLLLARAIETVSRHSYDSCPGQKIIFIFYSVIPALSKNSSILG